jgi:phage terminase large subunit-like protein
MRLGGDGKAVSLASSPDARDGARTTFQVCDETHRWTLPRLKQAHRTMQANLPKRYLADAWSLEVTTAPSPGEGSVAEDTMDYARQVAGGTIKDSRLFFFHRQAGDQHDLETPEGLRAAVIEASGPVAAWSDIDGICEQWRDPTSDRSYLERVWLNRLVRASERAFDVLRWDELAQPDYMPKDRAWITLGFDGARWHDSTALVATEIVTGFQWVLGLWAKPQNVEHWEVPEDEVSEAVEAAFKRWRVWRMYCDPRYWETTVAGWAGQYRERGADPKEPPVMEWWTNRLKPMAFALRSYSSAMAAGDVGHDGDPRLRQHLGNAVKKFLLQRDEDDKPLWVIYKERPDSPHKIDGAMAGTLSWEAPPPARTAGVGLQAESVYETRGLLVVG